MSIKRDALNARKHSDANKRAIRQSLEAVGAGRSILIDADENVLAGNGVLEQAEALGIPVKVIESDGRELLAVKRVDLTGDKARQAATLDNLTADTSAFDYDSERLRAALANDAISKAIAEQQEQLRALLREPPKAETQDPSELIDRAAQLQAKWQVQYGDLWEIGKHRILCGDSTNADDVAMVMQGEKAQAVVTDSPYGIEREGIANDDPKGLRELFDGALRTMPVENVVIINFQSL